MNKEFEQLKKQVDTLSNLLRSHLTADSVGHYFGEITVHKPKFEEGQFVRSKGGSTYKIKRVEFVSAEGKFYYHFDDNTGAYGSCIEKWVPKKGEYFTIMVDENLWICIAKGSTQHKIQDLVSFYKEGSCPLYYTSESGLDEDFSPATPEEIALLDTKLAEQGKRFDKEKCELVDIPKNRNELPPTTEGQLISMMFSAYLVGQADIKNKTNGLDGISFESWYKNNYNKL